MTPQIFFSSHKFLLTRVYSNSPWRVCTTALSAVLFPEKNFSATFGSSSAKTETDKNGPKKEVFEISRPWALVTGSGENWTCSTINLQNGRTFPIFISVKSNRAWSGALWLLTIIEELCIDFNKPCNNGVAICKAKYFKIKTFWKELIFFVIY